MFENDPLKQSDAKQDSKKQAVFDAAATVFAQYGFRRTSMNDIADAAGISRPAPYLMFRNKQDLFRQRAQDRQRRAIDEAANMLAEAGPIAERVTHAILAYERIYYEPVAGSPHGAEFMELNQGAVSTDMIEGRKRLIILLANALTSAETAGEISFGKDSPDVVEFAYLLMFAINGMKKEATSIDDFRRKIGNVTAIFMTSLALR